MLTTYADDRSVIDALRAGARGYLTKDASATQIRDALQRVTSGQPAIDPAVQQHLLDAITAGPPARLADPRRTPGRAHSREAEVLTLIARGLSNTEIASRSWSAKPPSRATSTTSSPRPASATAPRPSPTPTSTASPDGSFSSPPAAWASEAVFDDSGGASRGGYGRAPRQASRSPGNLAVRRISVSRAAILRIVG